MPKKITAWTTKEILEQINLMSHRVPITVREYQLGWADALDFLQRELVKLDKKAK